MNEKLEQIAHNYVDVVRDLVVAERKVSKAKSELDNMREARNRLAWALKEFVGANIKRKAVTLAGGTIVAIEYRSDNAVPMIIVYEDGEEVSFE